MTVSHGLSEIEIRIREAEEYYRHGLYKEASQIYEKLLSESYLDTETAGSIAERIRETESKIKEMESIDKQVLSSQDLDCIRSTWGSQEKPSDILQSGNAFSELGLYKEALGEFIKFVGKKDTPLQETAHLMVDSLLVAHPGGRILEPLNTFLKESDLSDKLRLDVIFTCGQDLLKRQMLEIAEDFFVLVKTEKPLYPGLSLELSKFGKAQKYSSRYAYLLEKNLVTAEKLQQALAIAKTRKKSVESVLMEEFRISKANVSESLKLFYNVPFKDFDPKIPVPHELVQKLKKTFLLENKWVPLSWDLNAVDILIDDPKNIIKTDQAQTLLNASHIRLFIGFKEDIDAYIHLFYKENHEEDDAMQNQAASSGFDMADIAFEEVEDDSDRGQEDTGEENSGHIVKMVDQILVTAYRKGASDIHIEPSPITKKTRIRYRIDGVCQEVLQLPNHTAKPLISRLKIMGRLDIAERRMPQDGKIKFKRKGVKPFELRLATLPTAGGFEDAVLRILAESGAMPLEKMGMSQRNLDCLQRVIRQPYGLVLVVGPTGSGKTTTLHAALGEINKPGIKIWTAEDPVEISQEGLRQVECQAKIGLDFARVMRAFLRADPDVIMIGEMRDHETASTGIEASLTGHLVFSTLHTNSAPETITRLLDMGLNPLNFSDAFLGVMAQRLVRRLCTDCKEAFHPTPEEFDEIQTYYGKGMEDAGLHYAEDLTLYRSAGCPECSNTGYRGRLGIHELLLGSAKIKQLIKRAAPTEEIFLQGASEGMTTLMQDGIAKVFQGLTDIEEVRRVCVS
ncbi:type II secretory ATPase GspE/PulE/Tfp pilus assembly ATPase PilB-like protein [Desulfobotulus alkaliphilus]|uniref:Type II secretory ATPase GspE/PulE/Tfp pilus assembly ATPase PilB-like protein n=1 Tax=Desulfobotulus alkaliphilus TaxID=622671 RepID=A0A562S0X7_9BACT|nr:GspE/PulE family protein [Desulfobotulus alkaliphilus]TWI74336.1 type II secretory ATPase GspE/PulE/Tfp pilus assembly ATPase PilB-like protein [Desulfobotulus alkaliphilus]